MAHSSPGSSQEAHKDKTNSQTPAEAGNAEHLENPDNQRSEHEQQKRQNPSPPEEGYISDNKTDGSWYQCPFTKSLHRAEALFRHRLSPSLKRLMRQKNRGCSWESENERITGNIQHLGEAFQDLRSRFHILYDPAGGRLFGCVTDPSSLEGGEFYQHPQAAGLSPHFCQLHKLMEQRAQLLFFHEYAHRTKVASCFVTQLGSTLERIKLLLVSKEKVPGQLNTTWKLNLRALCQELQVHVSHWDMLWAKARSDPLLCHLLFSCVDSLSSMQKTLRLLAMLALKLLERCICTAFSALAAAQLEHVPQDALVDLLCAVELYNQVVEDKSHNKRTEWSSHLISSSDWPSLVTLQMGTVPRAIPLQLLMSILAKRQAQNAAKHLYTWANEQSNLVLLTSNLGARKWRFTHSQGNSSFASSTVNIHTVQLEPQSSAEECHLQPRHGVSCSHFPFTGFVSQDRDFLDAFFQVFVTSTNRLDASNSIMIDNRISEKEERLLNRPRLNSRTTTVTTIDHRSSDVCTKTIYSYKINLWKEFGKAVVLQFYHAPYKSRVGSVNQWNDEMLLVLASWLKQLCADDLVPEECKGGLSKFRTCILSAAAFMRWDEMMCVSLGSGQKDKCVPGVREESHSVRTVTMDLILQLFPPLHTVLQLLQHHTDDHIAEGDSRRIHLELLCKSAATVQSSTYWVINKSHQFLASWSLCKFLLVTQGDLKDLKDSVECLVLSSQRLSRDSIHPMIIQQLASLSQALTDLQAFSDLVMKSFSSDCKRMAMEIFEQTMPSAKHWRISHRTESPSGPSDYAACAAQSVIGPVLEGVRPLSDDAQVPALTEATTAFLEAWMEHILQQKIKFSVHGALQLKRDFDLIRDLIRSEEYLLSEELLQRMLSLRVFHQVDNAIVCLLQQPMAKPYLPSRGWEPFRHCCPNSAQVMDEAAGSLNNLESMDIQTACQQAGSALTPDQLSSSPLESYLAVAQQEWLDLRIHNGSRWKLPVPKCFTNSEP